VDGNFGLLIAGCVGASGEFFIIPKMGNRPFSQRVGPMSVKPIRLWSSPEAERLPDSKTCCDWSI